MMNSGLKRAEEKKIQQARPEWFGKGAPQGS
jgi:hypothetical protein